MDQNKQAAGEAFVNALRRHPKESTLSFYVAEKGSAPPVGFRECSLAEIGEAVQFVTNSRAA